MTAAPALPVGGHRCIVGLVVCDSLPVDVVRSLWYRYHIFCQMQVVRWLGGLLFAAMLGVLCKDSVMLLVTSSVGNAGPVLSCAALGIMATMCWSRQKYQGSKYLLLLQVTFPVSAVQTRTCL